MALEFPVAFIPSSRQLFAGVLLYRCAANLITFAVFGLDKSRARWNRFRIRERTLLLLSLLGGSLGALVGMHFFRHKTKHWYFVAGMPLILILQLASLFWLVR